MSSRTDSQRKDSLSYLTTAITTRPVNTPLQQPLGALLPKLLPLILDGSNGVRDQLLKLLIKLPTRDIEDHVDQILLYIRAGMTHLAADIRSSTMDILSWALESAGNETVSCAGGWVKTLKSYLAVLGWSNEEQSASWSTNKVSFGKVGNEGKAFVKNLNVLAVFLRAGLIKPPQPSEPPPSSRFPLWHVSYHMLPSKSNCYAHLNLFGSPRDEDSEMYEDREDRQRIFHKRFFKAIERGIEAVRREGGELGRAAAAISKVMSEGMADYEVQEY